MKLENIDLNLLLSLYWLLEDESVTAAAERRRVTQPAMSRSLRELRNVFQDELLVRAGRGMVKTQFAESLLPKLADAILRLREVTEPQGPFDPKAPFSYSIACSDVVTSLVLRTWQKNVSPDAPFADLIMQTPSIETPQSLTSHQLDLVIMPEVALSNLPAHTKTEEFVQKSICEDRFVVASGPNHPNKDKRLSLKAFTKLNHVLISPTGSGPGVTEVLLESKGLSRRIAYRVPSTAHVIDLLQDDIHVAVVPRSIVTLAGGALVPIPTKFSLPNYRIIMAWHPGRTQNMRHRWVRDRIANGVESLAVKQQ